MRFEYKKFYSTDYKNLYNFFFNRNLKKKYVLSYQANIYRYTKLRILNIILVLSSRDSSNLKNILTFLMFYFVNNIS